MAVIGFANEKFIKTFYFEHGGKGSASGISADNARAIVDADLMAIEPGTVIERTYVVIDTAVTGSTAIDLGDDDDPNGFVITASLTLGTPGMYGYAHAAHGAYLDTEEGKYYAAAGKEVKLDVTGASTAGKFRVVVEGHRLRL